MVDLQKFIFFDENNFPHNLMQVIRSNILQQRIAARIKSLYIKINKK